MSKEVKSAYYGSFFHAPVYGEFEYLEDALIEVNGDGVIVRVVTATTRASLTFLKRIAIAACS